MIHIKEHNNWVTDVCFSYSGNYLASCSYDYNIVVWDKINKKVAIKIEKSHHNWLHGISFTCDDKYLISAS